MRTSLSVVLLGLAGCGSVANKSDPDAAVAADARGDAPGVDAAALGSQANPATSCVVLHTAGAASGVYYLKDSNGTAVQTYCEQERNGGGWALVYRSVLTATGTTTAFWQFPYAQRFASKGDPHPGENFYGGAVYRLGLDYMDTITDLQGTTVIAFVASTSGILESTMRFQDPVLMMGNTEIYGSQFAAGWSASDYDGDTLSSGNCTQFGGAAQHYTACFVYGLGADGEMPYDDGGVGPHVKNTELTALQLALQPNSGTYSRVNVIARYARW